MKTLFFATLLMLVACSQSPQDKQGDAITTTQSWIATARMTGEAWQQGKLPDAYTEQTLIKSQQKIVQQNRSKVIPSPLSEQLQQTLRQMIADVQQHRRNTIASSLEKLSNEQHQLESLAKNRGVQR